MSRLKLAAILACALLLAGCSSFGSNQPDKSALPALEYTRPEGEQMENHTQKTVKYKGSLSDGSGFVMYYTNELEISGVELTAQLKVEPELAESLKTANVLTLNVETVGTSACSDLDAIRQINLGENLSAIQSYAFSKCTMLDKVVFPASLTQIGDYAFQGCSSLRSADIPSNVTALGRRVFAECTMLLSANLDTDVGDSTFADCTSLRDVTFGAGCHIIGSNAFSGCVGIRSLSLAAPPWSSFPWRPAWTRPLSPAAPPCGIFPSARAA